VVWGGIGLYQNGFGGIAYYPGYDPLIRAIGLKDIAAVKRELDSGVDVNRFPPSTDTDSDAPNPIPPIPLDLAVQEHETAIVKLLLDRGADPNLRDAWDDPLTDAATADNVEIMALLFEHGGGKSKDDALRKAAEAGKKKAVAFLIAHGADPKQFWDGKTLSQDVADEGHPDIAAILTKASLKGKH
jgi:ankyrin repeat protein